MAREERVLVAKLDWFILSYCCLMYFSNYLDRSNISNAYVSGMKEDLNMLGTQFNKINTIFTCGYIVGMIPNNLMLQVVSPRIWFPSMQIIWAILTFCTSAVKNVEQIYAIRFFQGMAESSTFVGTHYVLGSWYKPSELGKRSGIFTSSGLVGTLFSGVLQAAVYKHLNGLSGRSGWRWLFIIDGIITLPIALYGFIVFPDLPRTTKAFYLSKEERILAYERLEQPDASVPLPISPDGEKYGDGEDEGQGEKHGEGNANTSARKEREQAKSRPLSWNILRRVLGRWRWYGCSLLFAISGETESFGSNNLMGQWLKSIGGYTVEQIDFYPSGATAFAIASTLICAFWTDRTRSKIRWPVLVYMSLAVIVSAACILVWDTPVGVKFFAYYLAGASYAGQATTFAWANQICADDDQERAVVLASMNMCNNIVNAWWSIVFYPATDAPRFRKGMFAMFGAAIATLFVTWGVWFLERRELRRAGDRTRMGGGSGSGEGAGAGEKGNSDRESKSRSESEKVIVREGKESEGVSFEGSESEKGR